MTQATNEIPGAPTTSSTNDKTKIAILGGGIASLSAAFELTASPELRSRYDVTVYQLGWRLGGKCASGRNAAEHDRIEEHGLHVWFGFYDNAFDVMKRCYEQVKLIDERAARSGATARSFASIEEAFLPCDKVVLYDYYGEEWSYFDFEVPRNEKTPGINDEKLPDFWTLIYETTTWGLAEWRKLSANLGAAPTPPGQGLPSHLRQLAEELGVPVRRAEQSVLVAGLHLVRALARHHLDHAVEHNPASPDPHLKQLCSLLDWCKGELWDRWVHNHLDHDTLRHYFSMFDVATAMVHGIVYDELFTRGFDSINDLEFMAWLQRHGAKDSTLEQSLLVRAFYDMAFAFRHGYKEWRPLEHRNMAAGVAVHDILRLLFTYKGSFYYKMNAGMGDTIFAPLYKVLKDRGVKFEFFHQVTKLGVGDDRASISSIELNRQARVEGGGEYDPLVEVKGLHCWPSEPDWDQLVDGEKFKGTTNFEWVDRDTQPAGDKPAPIKSADRFTLKNGVDFDRVILGIPAPAILNNEICTELMKYDGRFERMIKETTAVMTQAFQVWLTKKPEELGWPHDPSAIMTSFDEPVDTYCDMTHLLPQENWAASSSEPPPPVDLVYCCGVMPDPSPDDLPAEDIDSQQKADEYARRMVKKYVDETSEPLWPNARRPDGSFEWDVLYDPQNRAGANRLDAQFTRANYQSTERYVLTPAGSVKHRLKTHETRFTNLLIVGDWIKNGLDAGCVEAAAISGRQAARRITRVEDPIPGENGTWLDPSVGDSPLARPKVGHLIASPLLTFSALRVARGVATLGLDVAASAIETVFDCIFRPRPGPQPSHDSAAPPARLPQYVEYGGIASAPGPFECTDATLDAFLLRADHAHLRALCAKVFGGPSGGAVDYRPLGSHVMLTFGDMKVKSNRPEIGYVRERHAAFWVMTAAVTRSNGALVGQRLAAFVPSMFVDNPISLVGGREIYGFAKHGAQLTFPSDGKPDTYAVDAYGGQFGEDVEADYRRLLEVRGPAQGDTEMSWRTAQEFIDGVRQSVGGARPDQVSLSITLVRDIMGELLRHTARQVFLREFRAPDNSQLASPMQVVEARSVIHNLRGGPLAGSYQFNLERLDSHPLGDELGLISQNVPLAFRVHMDFTQEAGMVVWQPGPMR